MITEKMKNHLADINGKKDERKVDLINERGKEAITPEEEKARLRKAVYTLVSYMERLHPEIADEPAIVELKDYFGIYEDIKREVKAELGLSEV